jgi:hypothetical protein
MIYFSFIKVIFYHYVFLLDFFFTLSDLASCLRLSSSRSLDGETVIRRDATVIFSRQSAGEKTLQAGGVRDGNFLTVWRLSEVPTANSGASPARQRATTNPPAASGGLEFSALLAANGGLSFNIPGLLAASAAASQPIEWDGMKPTTPFNEIPTPPLDDTLHLAHGFQGMAVGVGKGKTLGKIHISQFEYNNIFPVP